MCKRFLTILLILSFITPLFYLPQQAQKAEALFGFGDLVIDIKALADRVVDGFAMVLAQKMIDRMVASTVKWAQEGFEGNPAYATDPEQYFTDIVDGVAGEFIQKDLNYLCSPFQANIKLSLTQQYYDPEPFQCTLTDVIGNIENFYNDFSQGGWDAWFSMTQNPTNNPYGAYLKAKIELDSQTASALGLKEKELDWNQGFLSWSECTKTNPPATMRTLGLPDGDPFGSTEVPNPDHVAGKAEGECIQRGPTKTPGSTIKAQLDEVLPSGLQKLIGAQHIDQLVNAFAAGLLERYVLGPKGLFNNEDYKGNEGRPIINPSGTGPGDEGGGSLDTDGDGISDGLDTDGDGDLDLCYFGGSEGAIGPPCVGSNEEITTSTNGGGSPPGGQCSVTGYQYEGALRDAMSAVLAENPAVGDLPNIESGGRQNARTFLALVETKLKSMGYEATDEVLNGNGNPSTGDIIAVWRSGDTMMERYDAIIGAAPTIRAAVTADFTGFIPLNCTSSGGGRDCGCKSNTNDPTPTTPTTPVPTTPTGVNPPLISSISPTSVTAGSTTLTINGTDLTATVQFFDGAGNRNTVLGSVNSTKTQVTILVPGDLPSGNATVKIYKDASTVSNGKLIQVTGTGGVSGPAPKAVEAELNLGPGTFPDVAFFDGRIYLAMQQPAAGGNKLLLYNWNLSLTDQQVQEIPYQGDQAFPKLTVYNNILWLAFRENYSSAANAVKLWRSDTQVIENLGGGFGNDPVAVQNGFVAWQLQQADGTWKIVRRALTGGSTTIVKNAVGTGLSRILANGTVVTIDEDRFAVSGYTRPWVAGGLTVTEGKSAGLFGFWNTPSTPFSITSSQFSLFPGQTVFAPHAATDGTLYAVTTWGPSGARIAVIKR